MDKVFYNEGSAAKLGWTPSWFGVKDFDEDLIVAIKAWQKKQGITADGLCGPTTYRRVYTQRESEIGSYRPFTALTKENAHIVHKGNFLPIKWDKVVLWSDSRGLKVHGGYTPYFEERKINFFVNHWDVCLNSESCAKVLNKRGISVHFCIDNDGTIYQLLDTNHAAWHAGSKKWNHSSIGVEITNAYYPKYQTWYERNGFGERPIVTDGTVHGGKLDPFTGFYDVQLDALKALWVACHDGLSIPYKCPLDKNGNTLYKVSTAAAANRFKGFVSHYHLTKRKIDCAGLDINTMLNELR
jgi:hypothetical protein